MKTQSINMHNKGYYINYKAGNKYAKYSIAGLIAGAAFFTGANALKFSNDYMYKNNLRTQKTEFIMNSLASVFSVMGTGLGLIALKKEDS